MGIRIYDDLTVCERLWERAPTGNGLFHAWEVRACFQHAFQRTPCFIAYEEGDALLGLLPLSRVDEAGTLAFFPGETWHQKTWLEGNRVFASSDEVFRELLEAVPGGAELRYLEGDCVPPGFTGAALDEVGYLFLPPRHGYSFESYQEGFRRKSLRRLLGEIDLLSERGVSFRHARLADIEWLFRMNLETFGEDSYFFDNRFLGGFERLIAELDRRGGLRVTTVLLGGTVAAVDIGAVWNNTYTLLAGGTNRRFPGVAKLINFHHLRTSCRERYDSVDFLCGDFGWKQRFQLTARPLLKIDLAAEGRASAPEWRDAGCASETPAYA